MADFPDLSHLTSEERSIIEGVIMRQRQEEERQNEIMRRKQDEVQVLEETIRARSEKHKKAGIELDTTCHICLKTKFADGVGHICNYCNIRCCARCGGKVSLRSNKSIWVCIVCRKKQELLSKSGQWMKSNLNSADNAMLRRMQEDMQGIVVSPVLAEQSLDKRPKLERAHSAAEKENLPLQRSSSVLRRQYSQQEQHPNAPWQVSSDGLRMTGQMILRKSGSSGGNILGLKVVGGKLLEDGTMGALIEKVKKGSSADVDGHLKAGDEVLEWNGIPLQGKSFQEVADIIAQSKQEPQVELVVTRNLYLSTTHGGPTSMTTTTTPIASRRLASQTQWKQKNESIPTTPLQLHHKVTSPGATDLHPARTRHHRHSIGNANVGGRLQLKTSFDPAALQLVVTLICATGLTPNSNGQPRNPYAKLYLLPDRSEKSKRRTKTLANTNDPRWDQTFVYNGIRCTELRHRALEITVWDYGKYGVNNFLGEVVLALGSSSLNNELEWHYLMAHEEHRQIGSYEGGDETIVISADCHLSPPSTTSRLSDSDTSECDITDYDGSREHRRTADGASISSIGSSSSHYSSPPPEKELCMDGEHRSRRDMLSQGRKRAAFMVRDHPSSISAYHHYFKEDHHRAMLGHRSLSAAPMDSPSLHYRGRSQSPTGHRSLSPPDHRSIPYSHGYVTRFTSKSATATPTGSPKKRQLPQIPHLHAVLKDRVASDFEERSRFIRYRNRPVHMTYRNTDTGGWEKHYSGLSDSDLPSISRDHHSLLSHAHRLHRSQRGRISSKKDIFNDFGDSDMESVASVTSSAFSTQSERPRASRGLISRRRAKDATSDWTSSFDSLASQRSHLVPKARSFEDDIVYCSPGDHLAESCSSLSRRARSFEYETVSGNIFSDDSLRTAREKLKKNLSISDSRYGDKIPALKDQSKSYYDSNGETKSKIIADVAKDCFRGSRPRRYYFGYEHSPALDYDLTEFRRFESPIKRSMDALGIIDYESCPEDAFRRKYKHLYYYDDECDCQCDRRFQTPMALREDLYSPSEHIYCSIDELMSPTDRYDKYAYLNDPIDRRKCRTASWEDSLYSCFYSRPGSKRRARSTDSYLDDANHYENWYVDTHYPRDSCLASYDNEYFDDSGDEFIDYKTRLNAEMSQPTNAQFQSDPYDDPLPHYFSPDEYDRTIHDSRPTHPTDHYFESSSPRRRRKRDYEAYYENVPVTSHLDDYSPRFAQQPVVRASSTPVLYSDGELESPDYQRRLRLKRRKRNMSCPESRQLSFEDESELHVDGSPPRLFFDSDEDFGSVETVINRPSKAAEIGPSGDEVWARREPQRQRGARTRKTSCPECRDIEEQYASRRRKHEQDHSRQRSSRYRRRNSSCPEAREIEFYEERRDPRQQQSSKRNVAISDTLEYYEYSMESESQCSENCGFGPSNPRRPRNRAPRPVNANSNIFDSQTATSDTAKNPRATVEHENPASRNHAKTHRSATITPSADAYDQSSRRRSRKQSTTHDYHDDQLDDDGNNRRSSSMPESSDYASQSSSYEKPSRHELPGNGHAKRGQFSRSFSNTDAPTDEKADGSLSDTAVGLHADDRSGRGRRSSPGSKSGSGSSSGGVSAVQYQSGMGKKSNSTSQLSATGGTYVGDEGRKRRLGFGKKGKSSFTVHRSEEVLPEDTASGRSGRQPSSASSDGEGSIDGDSLRVAGESGNLSEFIEGLGPGQLVGRQVVATPSVGDIQLTLRFNKGQLEIEVVRATKLQRKKGTNTTPAPFVKVYLVNGKKCIAKAKTSPARKTLEPLFQQNLTFRENFKGCILQVTVWGDYGRLEGRKVFMGVAQIMLDKLNLNEMVFGWYKLYGTASL